MDEKQIEPHVEDISRVLGKKVDKDEIRQELLKSIVTYRIDLAEAKRSIVSKHGGEPGKLMVSTEKSLSELGGNENSVDVLCRIESVNEKEINVKGVPKRIFYGFVTDAKSKLQYTAWTGEFPFERGDVLRIKNAYTKEYQGVPQLNFGDRVVIDKEERDLLPAFEQPAEEHKVKDFRTGLGNVTFQAKIISVEKREVTVNGEQKEVFSGLLADETAKARFSAWHDFKLKKGMVIRVEGAYTKTWRGLPQVNFDERCKVEKLKEKMEVAGASPTSIYDIEKAGGGIDVLVRGAIVDVKKGSGLIFRCPECNRVIQNNICRSHGKVDGNADLRIKAVIDDGTSTLTLITQKELTEKILGKDLEECKAIAQKSFNFEVIQGEISNVLLGRAVEAQGNVTSDDFGLMMVADGLDFARVDVQAEARQLLEELGVD